MDSRHCAEKRGDEEGGDAGLLLQHSKVEIVGGTQI